MNKEYDKKMCRLWHLSIDKAKEKVPENSWYLPENTDWIYLLYSEPLIMEGIKIFKDDFNISIKEICEWWLSSNETSKDIPMQIKTVKRVLELNK